MTGMVGRSVQLDASGTAVVEVPVCIIGLGAERDCRSSDLQPPEALSSEG